MPKQDWRGYALPPEGGTFGEALRARRDDVGLTQTALAERSGVPQSLISAYELDRKAFPHHAHVHALEEVLGLARGELLARTGWARAEQFGFRGPASHPQNIFIEAPSETLRELIGRILLLDPEWHDRLLRMLDDLEAMVRDAGEAKP